MRTLVLFTSLTLLSGFNCADASEMKEVPAGEFILGDNADEYASPKRTTQLETFSIDRFEVTNEEFQQQFSDHTFWKGFEPHPVTNITWYL